MVMKYGIYSPATNKFSIVTDRTDRLVVDEVGSVGIGTATPVEKLDVNGHIRIRGNNRSLYFDGDPALFKTAYGWSRFRIPELFSDNKRHLH